MRLGCSFFNHYLRSKITLVSASNNAAALKFFLVAR